jgi:hypothetical protein
MLATTKPANVGPSFGTQDLRNEVASFLDVFESAVGNIKSSISDERELHERAIREGSGKAAFTSPVAQFGSGGEKS